MMRVRFWQAMSVVVWALSLVIGLFCAIMPPLNLVTVPAFFLIASGVVGAVANEIDEAKAALSKPKLARRAVRKPIERFVVVDSSREHA